MFVSLRQEKRFRRWLLEIVVSGNAKSELEFLFQEELLDVKLSNRQFDTAGSAVYVVLIYSRAARSREAVVVEVAVEVVVSVQHAVCIRQSFHYER